MSSLGERIKEKAVELGFDSVGFTPAGVAPRADAFHRWLDAGHHAEMAWLARDPARRADPRHVVEGARSLIMVGFSYALEMPSPDIWNDPSRGRIARYAWGQDYHDELLPPLMKLADFIREEGPPDTLCRAYTDTGPLLEKSWAAAAGLGFIGKNTLTIDPKRGSLLMLGGIITSLELEGDDPVPESKGTCGNCRRCLDICPTHAFPAPYILDSARCISYLTIELKTAIPEELRSKMGSWIFGCDECQTICPWVRRITPPSENRFLTFDSDRFAPDLIKVLSMDNVAFRAAYKGTPVVRAKRRGLLRNAAVALGNWGDASARPALTAALEDPEPLIREHAAWALERINA